MAFGIHFDEFAVVIEIGQLELMHFGDGLRLCGLCLLLAFQIVLSHTIYLVIFRFRHFLQLLECRPFNITPAGRPRRLCAPPRRLCAPPRRLRAPPRPPLSTLQTLYGGLLLTIRMVVRDAGDRELSDMRRINVGIWRKLACRWGREQELVAQLGDDMYEALR